MIKIVLVRLFYSLALAIITWVIIDLLIGVINKIKGRKTKEKKRK